MILIAPDKFKGTLTAREAAVIIAEALAPLPCVKYPMADGGEGTAQTLCTGPDWQQHDCYYVNPRTRTAVIDSSAVIGIKPNNDILRASSAPLGIKVREILKSGCEKVIIGIGGTGTCDGGIGFLEALGMDHLANYRDKIVGLCDVRVPLIAPLGQPSALMFAPQKGATPLDLQVLYQRLTKIQHEYSHHKSSPYDGAGGGLGFAIATVLGAKCYDGAKYVFESFNIRWDSISLAITGEGCIDAQTAQGKVVQLIEAEALAHGVPCIAIGGCVKAGHSCRNVVDASAFYPEKTLDKEVAKLRLQAAALLIAGQGDLAR